MNAVDIARNRLIDKLLLISSKSYLDALYKIIEQDSVISEKVQLSESQIEMLRMSEEDYKAGRFITHEQLEKEDIEWLEKL
jgi:predicted transcriptional regulator